MKNTPNGSRAQDHITTDRGTQPAIDERIPKILGLLTRLEGLDPQSLTSDLKIQIAQAWRIIEHHESSRRHDWLITVAGDSQGPWTVGIVEDETRLLNAAEGGRSLRYAVHRAALTTLADRRDSELYDALHDLREALSVTDVSRSADVADDRYCVILDPGSVNRRPRLPLTISVAASRPSAAEFLARWSAWQRTTPGPVANRDCDRVVAEMYDKWELDDVRLVLPTIYEMAAAAQSLDLPKTLEGRRLKRMIEITLADKAGRRFDT